jgi:hypothetical protein
LRTYADRIQEALAYLKRIIGESAFMEFTEIRMSEGGYREMLSEVLTSQRFSTHRDPGRLMAKIEITNLVLGDGMFKVTVIPEQREDFLLARGFETGK